MPRQPIRATLRRLPRATRGTSLLEMGFILPVFGLLMLGLVCVAITVAQKLLLQQAVSRALELASAGGATYATTQQSLIAQEAATAASVPASQVQVVQWLECDGVLQTTATTCNPGQQVGRYVSVQINATYTLPFSLPFGQNTIPLGAYSSVRLQ